MKRIGIVIVSAIVVILIAVGIYVSSKQNKKSGFLNFNSGTEQSDGNEQVQTLFQDQVSFVHAARTVSPTVVHIRTTYNSLAYGYSGSGSQAGGSGSGVIISEDGYIATNNHVIENAVSIEVVLADRRSFTAELVGRDPNTDLALLKINSKGLKFARMGNSDRVEIGEWVLAIGYPYSLNTTVTAGIVSAKGRNIGIINNSDGASTQINSAVESFIQTDAAINPGNSGGALVNTAGELIGINTAIASLTGSFAGYAFAIPVALAKKILEDLKEFGKVKRAVLGVSFPSPFAEEQYLKQQGINPGAVNGVFITGIQELSAASEAGLKEGDIIQSIDGIQLMSSAEFSERIARQRPGDRIELGYLRNNTENKVFVILKEDKPVSEADSDSLQDIYNKLGATFSPLSSSIKERFQLKSGVLVDKVRTGGFFYQIGIPPGTIIVYINGIEVNSPQDIEKELLKARNNRVQILAIAPDGTSVIFRFSFGV